jgi:uncharacterized protein
MAELMEYFDTVVLQPTTLCNLDCRYCYLPLRQVNKRMTVEVASAVAHAIAAQGLDQSVEVLWHGGEPMACGISHFRQLLAPFESLRQRGSAHHYIQTNATLINDAWCELFRNHQFRIGVSIDGPAWMTDQRIDLRGASAHSQVLRGIECLKNAAIPFSTIAVVNRANICYPRELYKFFCELGCLAAAFNIEEQEGVNTDPDKVENDAVLAFWKELLDAWSVDPRIQLRETNRALSFVRAVLRGEAGRWGNSPLTAYPTVAWDGGVVLLAPELVGAKSERYHDFVIGNVLKSSLVQLVRGGSDHLYVSDFLVGVERCRTVCPYFNFCQGGHASNKFQELGTTDGTETDHCRNTRQRLLDAVVELVQ